MTRPNHTHCALTIRSAWPLITTDDKNGSGALKVATDSASKSLTATVCTRPAQEKNKISASFARRLLDDDGYHLACLSTAAASLGQIAAIVSWTGTARLWTAYFILDEFLDLDLKLARSSWRFLSTLTRLPCPWPATIDSIVSGADSSNGFALGRSPMARSIEHFRYTCHTYREAFSDTVSLTGSETSNFSMDSAETPSRSVSSVAFSVAETDLCEPESNEPASVPTSPCRDTLSSTTEDAEQITTHNNVVHGDYPVPSTLFPEPLIPSGQSSWVWDKHRNQYHLTGSSGNNPEIWFDPQRFL